MFCKNCGNELSPTDKFCNNCGASIESNPVEPFTGTENVESESVSEPVTEEPVVSTSNEPTVENPTIEEPTVNEPVISVPVEPVINTEAETPTFEQSVANSMNNTPKKSNVGFIVLVIVLGFIILCAGGFIAYKIFTPKSGNTPTTNNTGNTTTPSTTTSTPTTQVDNSSTYKAAGYKFTIPTGWKKVVTNDIDYIGDSSFLFADIIIDNTYKYSAYKTNWSTYIEQYKTSLANSEYTGISYISSGEYTYGGKNYLVGTFYSSNSGTYSNVVVTEMKDGKVFSVITYFRDLSAKEDGYKKLSEFVDSAILDDSSSFSSSTKDGSLNKLPTTTPDFK